MRNNNDDFLNPFIFDFLSEKRKKQGFTFLQEEYCRLNMTINDLNCEIEKLKQQLESEKDMNCILTKELENKEVV